MATNSCKWHAKRIFFVILESYLSNIGWRMGLTGHKTKAKWENIVYEKGLYYLGHSLMQFGDYGAEYRSAAESLPLEGGS